MLEKIKTLKIRYEEILLKLQEPDIFSKNNEYVNLLEEEKSLRSIIELYNKYKDLENDIKEIRDSNDKELKELISDLKIEQIEILEKMKLSLKDPDDNRNVILEIKAAAGGDEACLFAFDLFRMYLMYAAKNGWETEIINKNGTNKSIKEVTLIISGTNVYSKLKHENGVHRVQRVPKTESKGRVHTSTVSVIVMPKKEEKEITINLDDCKFDRCRASGNGGQCVNTTDSAVRLTHIPSGIVIYSQTEKSQHQNKAKAISILQAKLERREKEERLKEDSLAHKEIIKNQDRAEKCKTYNFKENRYTDHNLNLTIYNLQNILNGNLDEIIDKYLVQNN